MKIRVKICGITSPNDATMVELLGVDAVGIIFYSGSSRCISIEQAKKIRQALGSFTTLVGLFVNETIDKVLDIASTVHLDVLQLHGNESLDYCQQLDRPYIKAIPATKESMKHCEQYSTASGILLDTPSENFGGSGMTFDWSILPEPLPKHTIIAGGINASNVGSICTKAPYAIDVNSALESVPGVKDEALVANFMNQMPS